MSAAGAQFDPTQVRRFIELAYPLAVVGKLHISSTGDYVGQQFDRGDVDGLTSYVWRLDQAGKQSIYLRATTDRPGLGVGKRGGAADSVELVGLWSDLDIDGPGHKHDPSKHGGLVLPPDEQNARRIVGVAALPEPTMWIHSGGGVYGWWLLDVPFAVTDDSRAGVDGLSKRWQGVLGAGAESLGFYYGTSVSDLARVLRLPGTVNRKVTGDPRPCRILADDGPRYSLDALISACDAAERARDSGQPDRKHAPRQVVAGSERPTVEELMKGDAGKPWVPVAPGTGSPFDDFETRTDWADILRPAGWTEVARHSDGTRQWVRPGKDTAGISATTGRAHDRDRMWNFSDNAGLPTNEPMTKPFVFAAIYHNGDMKAAAAQLYTLDYGARRTDNTPTQQTDDTEFWTTRPVLTHIRDFALSRRASPWAVLGVVLVRVIAATPPRVVLPPLVGSVASLNLFVALVGPSGSGKGAAMAVGDEAVDLGPLGGVMGISPTAEFAVHTVGSGQGIAHAYAHYEKDLGTVRHAESAIFSLEEIDHLVGLAGQTGSTVTAELRRLYMGERLGHLFVDVHKRMEVPAHTYRAGLIVGLQPARAGVLLDETEGGTPQRFLWLPVTYPHSKERPSAPTQAYRWSPPPWVPEPATVPAPTVYQPQLPVTPNGQPYPPQPPVVPPETRRRVTLLVAECAVKAIDEAHLARSRGEGDPLDGHRLLCREKVAAALAILDGRTGLSESDWELAGRVMALSDHTRAQVVATLNAEKAKQNTARGKAEADRAVIIDDAKEETAVKRAARSVLRILNQHDGWMSHNKLRTGLSRPARQHFEEAVRRLLAAGQVSEEKTAKGVRYRLAAAL